MDIAEGIGLEFFLCRLVFCDIGQSADAVALQADLDAWMEEYNRSRPHQGRWCFGKTPMQTFLDTLPLAREKLIQAK